MFRSFIKREMMRCHAVVVQWQQRNVPKKCDALAKVFFLFIEAVCLFPFVLLSLLLLLFFDVLLAVAVITDSTVLILLLSGVLLYRLNIFTCQAISFSCGVECVTVTLAIYCWPFWKWRGVFSTLDFRRPPSPVFDPSREGSVSQTAASYRSIANKMSWHTSP